MIKSENYLLYTSMIICWLFVSCTKKIADKIDDIPLKILVGKVITIDESTGTTGPCEPTICINPKNGNNIIAGAVLDHIYLSNDGGLSWEKKRMKSSFGVYGDPVVRITSKGNAIYAHLSNPANQAYTSQEFLDRIVVQTSSDNGNSWSDGSYAESDHTKDHDKHWISVGPENELLMGWTEFNKYGSKIESDKSRILFSKSLDMGKTWTKAIAISELEGDCKDDDQTTEGAYPVIGKDGTYYVVWSYDNRIFLDKSFDKGKTWLKNDIVVAEQKGGWAFNVPGVGRCNGMPSMACDYSSKSTNGNLYISWSDQQNGENDTDIWMISSNNNGKSWSSPVRVNNDAPGKHQFFSAMTVDQVSGFIYVVFYDRRNYDDNFTDVYLAFSKDGGLTFENIKISETSFLPEPYVFFGDYNDISAYNGQIRPIWTEQNGKKLSVKTATISIKNN